MKILWLVFVLFVCLACQERVSENKQAENHSLNSTQIKSDSGNDELIQQSDSLRNMGYQTFTYKEGDQQYLMQQYFMVRLMRGKKSVTDSSRRAQLQKEHMEHLARMYEMGHASLIGPMADGSEWRGIVVYNTPNKEMADSLARLDPMVQAGLLEVETTGWWTAKGGKLK